MTFIQKLPSDTIRESEIAVIAYRLTFASFFKNGEAIGLPVRFGARINPASCNSCSVRSPDFITRCAA
jgi:hypothetical protein